MTAEWSDDKSLLVHFRPRKIFPARQPRWLRLWKFLPLTSGCIRITSAAALGASSVRIPWGIECAQTFETGWRQTGKAVSWSAAAELMVAGSPPVISYARVKVGAKKDGTIVAWDSESWGTGGPRRRRLAAPAIRFQYSEPAQTAHRSSDEYRSGASLARA